MPTWLHQAALAAALACGLLAAPALAQQDAAVIKRATDLRQGPAESSASLGALAADTTVTRTSERKGSWVKVRTAQGTTGWVHMFDVGAQAGAAAAGSAPATSGLRSLGGLFGGGSTTTATATATATVGIRGLSAEDIAHAQPNPAAVQQAEKLRVSADQAQRFASAAALRQQNVEPLPEPPRPTAPAGSGEFTPDNQSFN